MSTNDVPARLSQLSAAKRALLERRLRGQRDEASEAQSIRPRAGRGPSPLSFAQQRLWFIDQLEPGKPIYNIPLPLRLNGPLKVEALRHALNEIVRRHDALRTTFAVGPDLEPVQSIAPSLELSLRVEDLSGLPGPEREAEAVRLATCEAQRPFDLERGPLLRARLLRLGTEEHVLLFTMHHIVSDGWSMGVLVKEVAQLYEAFAEGRESPLPPLAIQYADFAEWQREWLHGEVLEAQLAYWKGKLGGELPVMELPADRPRPPVPSFRGGFEVFKLSPEVTEGLRSLSHRTGGTLFMTLLAAYKLLLYRHTGQEDILVGSPVANRNRVETEDLIGFFVNTLMLRTSLAGDPTFAELLGRVRRTAVEAYAHQDLPFEKIVEELHPQRDLSRSPLFQVLLALQNAPMGTLELTGLTINAQEFEWDTVRLDLEFHLHDLPDGLGGAMAYNADIFERETVRRLLGRFASLLEAVVAAPERRLSELSVLAPGERQQLLDEWARGAALAPTATVHALFEAQAARTPQSPAVVFGERVLSYGELDRRAGLVARRLRALGVRPESRVGLLLERSPDQLAALLGVLKAGGAYVPIDPATPPERVAFVLRDAGAELVLTQASLAHALPAEGPRALLLDAIDEETVDEDAADEDDFARGERELCDENAAYVIYTSGSTGRPKGVVVSHASLAGAILAQLAQVEAPVEGTPLQMSYAFDGSLLSIFCALTQGGVLALPPEGRHGDPAHMSRLIAEGRLSHLFTVPSFYSLLLEQARPGELGSLRAVTVGAEACPPELVGRHQRALPGVPLFNEYGPTEATIYCAAYECVPGDAERASLPIGRPAAGARLYVLDNFLQPAPPGVPGQLYVGGRGVARGYLNRPELTAAAFVPDPFSDEPGARLYRTGDVARWLADGQLEFLGRADEQVKVRGFRVEPGEIESALRVFDGVRDAAVVAREDAPGERRLVAYVVAGQGPRPTTAVLREHLRARLPEYMVPGAFVFLDELPLTPTGKVNRRQLPAPEAGADASAASYVAPRTPTEELMARLWCDVLRLESVSAVADFFDLGGHSLLATQLISRVRDSFSVELPLRSIFESPTVEGLARHVEASLRAGAGAPSAPLVPVAREGDLPLSFAQQRLWFIHQLEPGSSAYNMPVAVRLNGTLHVAALERTLSEIVRRHESLRTRFALREGSPVQLVDAPEEVRLDVRSLEDLPAGERVAEARRLAEAEASHAFDLERGPLYRARLLRLSGEEHVLLFTMHHIVSDGWSMGVLVKEVAQLYEAFAEGRESPLEELPVQYADFAVWQRRHLSGELQDADRQYWKQQLGGTLPVLELPADRPRPPFQSFRGASRVLTLDAELSARLKALAQREGVTLFMLLLAAFKLLLYRYTGQEDVVVGTPIANRNRVELEGLIGFFVNTLVLRTDLSGRPSFVELLRRARAVSLGAYAHQEMPFEQLVEHLQPERSTSRSPLFQVMFSLQNAVTDEASLPGLTLQPLEVERVTTQFDLSLDALETADGVTAVAEYSTDLFDGSTVERMLGHFRAVLEGVVADPHASVAEVPLLTAPEREQLLAGWNDAALPHTTGESLHELFEARAARAPDAPAVIYGDARVTYGELNARANQLAHYLKELGVGAESRVCVLLERSPVMVIGLLAVLKAGGAYVPLDPRYPKARLDYMLEDAGASLLLTRGHLAEEVDERRVRVVRVDADAEHVARQPAHNPAVAVAPENLAYVIYTSGSTGRPKGVCVTRGSLLNHQRAVREAYGLNAGDRVLQFASLSFDVAAEEIFPTLLCGATLVLRDERVPGVGNQVEQGGVTVLNLPASAWHEWMGELSRTTGRVPESLRVVVTGSEQVARASLAAWKSLGGGGARLLNAYGTTETTITTTLYEPAAWADGAHAGPALPLGRPVGGARAYVLDSLMQPVPVGVAGELHVGGAGVARGYLGRPGLTAERFIPDSFSDAPGARLYRTGDLVRYLPDGNIEFLGRCDQQVKLRGFRIEPGEIEAALCEHASVRRAVVETRAGADGHERLVAYVEAEGGPPAAKNELREYLRERLPEFMVPSAFVFVDEFPLTPSGKLDRRALPAPGGVRDEAEALVPPRSEVERVVAAIWREALGLEQVGVHDNFFDLGGHSLLLVRVHSELRQAFDADLTMLDLFKYPTISALAGFIAPEADAAPRQSGGVEPRAAGAEVAVVGMAGRFPGARTVEQFWQNLRDGVESVTFFSDDELLAAGVDPEVIAHPNYVKAGVLLDDIDKFDAMFFGYNPREAEAMDPQHRLFLECAWEAIERAGYDPERTGGPVGVFAGAGPNSYLYNLYSRPDIIEELGDLQIAIGNEKDHLPTHVSYKLNLRGPSVAVQAACSTSLVAVHMACRSLLDGECRMALAGGVTVANYNKTGYVYHEGGISSPDGHCRAFDAEARGTLGGSGVGVVLLKRLADALADGDIIHAVIKGSAVNNDGSAKVGYAAPGVEGQTEVIRSAQMAAGVRPETVSYVEAHGTGTPLGDPIEVAALTQAFRATTDEKGFCAIGSLKTNMGHLDAAAGVGGLIKTVLALEHRELPPSLHFGRPNPALGLDDSPFYVNTKLAAWERGDGPRRAGVSSFGIGGTNAHVVLEESPAPEPSGASRPWQLLSLSAKTDAALAEATSNLAGYLRAHPESDPADLADVAYTLQVGRKTFGRRRVVVCRDGEDAAAALEALDPRRVFTSAGDAHDRHVVFMFPGQGAQYTGMGEGLYRSEPVFREQVDACCELLKPNLGFDLRDVLYPGDGRTEEAAARLKQTRVTQPALFVVEYALARLWMSWGLNPSAMIGHSIGEYVAACLAGVFSLEDALSLVAFRGELMQSLPEGAMLAVSLPEDEVRGMLGRGLSVAAANGPALCTVAGTHDAIEELQSRLAEMGVECRRLLTSHAFHSAMVEPIVARFVEHVGGVKLNAPRLRYVSNVTGTWVTAREATGPDYWGRHLRQTVRFADGVRELLKGGGAALLEVGPGRTLSTTVRALAHEAGQVVVGSLRHPHESCSDDEFLTGALGKLWLAGVRVDWPGFYAGQRRRRVQLPTYPFERRRYWVEWQQTEASARGRHRPTRREPDVADWFYLPYWKPSARPAATVPAGESRERRGTWLVFADGAGLSARIVERLERDGREVITVNDGERFERADGGGGYAMNVARQEDYESLLLDLKSRGKLPGAVLHSLCVTTPGRDGDDGGEFSERALDESFYSLTFLARALGRHGADGEVSITVLSNGVQSVTGDERLTPEKATALGPCKVIPQEYPNLNCRSVDVVLPASGGRQEERLVAQVVSELASDSRDDVVAYREGRRWVQAFEPVRLGARPGEPSMLRESGVYLITGGLGGIGLVLARHLARTLRAKLILTGRSALPPREEWARWLETHAAADELSVKLREMASMEEDGAEVLALEADAADAGRMREVVALARRRFGRIDGVIHAAGISPGGMIEAKTVASAAGVLAPKVKGTRVLEELFKEEQLDFLALFSSLVSVTGAFGQVDYCAANAFLDAFAGYNSRRYGTPTVSVNWDTWRDVGMAVKAGAPLGLGGAAGGGQGAAGQVPHFLADGISSAEGVEVFERILADGAPTQVLVSTKDLQSVMREAGELTRSQILEEVARLQQTRTAHPRPDMQVAYVAPRNELEERIAGVWQSVLGIEQVGVEDNFFDLGGHSLLATQLVSRLRELLRAEIPLSVVFERPTVAGLAEFVGQAAAGTPAEQPPPAAAPIARQARRAVRRTNTPRSNDE
ncbi:MAG: amino acid adenylation domain-containing protein [Pyrinomonadaceae bacterium]